MQLRMGVLDTREHQKQELFKSIFIKVVLDAVLLLSINIV